MMIIPEKRSGYGNFHDNIRYLSVWEHSVFKKQKGEMKFLSGKLDWIVDVKFSEDKSNIIVVVYPHAEHNANLLVAAHNKMNEILALLNEKDAPKVLTLDISENPRKIVETDFNRYSPSSDPQNEMFIFSSTETSSGSFPLIFVYEGKQRATGEFKRVFEAIAMGSSVLMDCEGEATTEGVEFCYQLFISYLNKEFVPFCPSIHNVGFPTNGRLDIPKLLNIKELEKLAYKAGADKVIYENGKIVYKEDEDISDETVKQILKESDEVFGLPSSNELGLTLQGMILKGESVPLSMIYQFGMSRFLSMLPIRDVPVEISPDIPGVARRMCVFAGQYHIIPVGKDEKDLVELFNFFDDGDTEMIHLCESSTFPRVKLLPSPKGNIQ